MPLPVVLVGPVEFVAGRERRSRTGWSTSRCRLTPGRTARRRALAPSAAGRCSWTSAVLLNVSVGDERRRAGLLGNRAVRDEVETGRGRDQAFVGIDDVAVTRVGKARRPRRRRRSCGRRTARSPRRSSGCRSRSPCRGRPRRRSSWSGSGFGAGMMGTPPPTVVTVTVASSVRSYDVPGAVGQPDETRVRASASASGRRRAIGARAARRRRTPASSTGQRERGKRSVSEQAVLPHVASSLSVHPAPGPPLLTSGTRRTSSPWALCSGRRAGRWPARGACRAGR